MAKEQAKKQRKERDTKLTDRQLKFAAEYLRTGNGAQSVLAAGYSNKTPETQARRLLKKPKVAKRIRDLTSAMVSKKIASAQEVLEFLTSMMRGEVKEPMQVGYKVQFVTASAKERINAAKELLKRYPTDELSKAQIRKILADARLSEAKAKQLEEGGHDVDDSLSAVLSKIKSADEATK